MKLLTACHSWSKGHTGGQEERDRAAREEVTRVCRAMWARPRNYIVIQELTGSRDGLWGREGRK